MDSSILDVAIGIVFFYASLSLACTTITEYVSRKADLRTKKLEQGLAALLGTEGVGAELEDVVTKIMTHPLVAPKGLHASGKPTEIAPRAFAAVVFDIVRGGRATSDLGELRQSVHELPETEVRKALLTVIDAAGDDIEKARTIVAEWFEGGMQWVSSWYKRSVQLITRWSAVVLVIALNADTTVFVHTLWTDQAIRESIASAADGTVANPAAGPQGTAQPDQFKELREQAEAALNPFPLGWSLDEHDPRAPRNWHAGGMARLQGIALKFFGLLITVVALAVGGPFWFDVLKKMVNLRGEIKGPK